MSPLGIPVGLAAAKSTGYQIGQSLRFDDNDSAHLSRTPSTAGNRQTWTYSGWIKRGRVGYRQQLLNSTSGAYIEFVADNTIRLEEYTGSVQWTLKTNAVYRDNSAWYHIVVAFNSTESTSSNRIKLWINSEQVTSFSGSSYPALNHNSQMNTTSEHRIGEYYTGSSEYFDGYMAEVNFIDGSALGPESFGKYDANGVWTPVGYTGSYTGQSWYLKFASGDGTDSSGLSNTWTASNFTTSGTGTDVMSDTPVTNWCTWNPVHRHRISTYSGTFSEGNLKATTGGSTTHFFGTQAVPPAATSGYYFEITADSIDTARTYIGLVDASGAFSGTANSGPWEFDNIAVIRSNSDYLDGAGTDSGAGTSYTNGDTIMVAYKEGSVWFGKNGTWMASGDPAAGTNAIATDLDTSVFWAPYASYNSTFTANFGQRDFAYTPPTGFKALNTSNLPVPTIKDGSDYFNTVLYSGNGTSQSLTVGFQPDWIWTKPRNAAGAHVLVDAVRGNTKFLESNSTGEEQTRTGNDGVTSFDTNGYSIGSSADWNASSETFVSWNWLAGGSGSTNTNGSEDSTVSVSVSSGFSIVNFTGTGSALTVGHGLGVAPDLMIAKSRDQADNWVVWHNTFDMDEYVFLEANYAKATTSNPATFWNNTAPTSTVVSVGANSNTNVSGNDTILYCFAEVEGFSKIGSYTGNGNLDGVFNHCGFKPAWLLVRRTNTAANWHLVDSTRSTYNLTNTILLPDLTNQESTYSNGGVDLLSNGFKIRSTGQAFNNSGDSYIFVAFAQNPFGGSGVSPATAR